jgi:transposase-like protein
LTISELRQNLAQIEAGVTLRLTCGHCGSGWAIRYGKDRHGSQRVLCRGCGATRTVEPRRGGNRISLEKEDALRAAFAEGLSIRAAARSAGVAKRTAEAYAEILGRPVECRCGKPINHLGWCGPRIAQSPPRQAYLRRVAKAGRRHLSEDEALALQFLALGTPLAEVLQLVPLDIHRIQALAAIPAADRPGLISEVLACEPSK